MFVSNAKPRECPDQSLRYFQWFEEIYLFQKVTFFYAIFLSVFLHSLFFFSHLFIRTVCWWIYSTPFLLELICISTSARFSNYYNRSISVICLLYSTFLKLNHWKFCSENFMCVSDKETNYRLKFATMPRRGLTHIGRKNSLPKRESVKVSSIFMANVRSVIKHIKLSRSVSTDTYTTTAYCWKNISIVALRWIIKYKS